MEATEKSYSTKVVAKTTAEKAFKALTVELEKWWGEQDYHAHALGDVFKVSWGEPWYQFKVIEYQLNEKLVWECIDAHQIIIDLDGVQKEWVDTTLVWDIKPITGEEVEISFVHKGLVQKFICYDVCSSAWCSFVGSSLKNYLEESID